MKPRPLLKTFTFAILHFATAFIVVYALTGNVAISGAAALIEPLLNTVVFYFHERAWNRFGRQTPQQSHSYGHDVFMKYLARRKGTRPEASAIRRS
ncbi:DUF2061 domain-containing protein [Stutzerimonas stutzeri]|uniref:DUF2061 domain-containing protein n=1 Tax=Stutzerimonas stutzeri TaxID=316 RepID=UPI001BCF1CC7|nr:DUF2061 domain-containing protein [Stutzerimonas stutzeri]UVO19960.1 DUF2061 domain-containing protein [Stutzerimonas stutzeri]